MKSALLQFASALVIPLLLTGCSTSQTPVAQLLPAVQSSPQAPQAPQTSQSPTQPLPVVPSATVPVELPQSSLQPASRPVQTSQSNGDRSTQVAQASMQRDYDVTTPLPSTGQVTIRGSIRTIQPDQLIADCPTDSAPYALAESTNYRVQICSEEYDPWLPKYYIGQAKDGSGELRITSADQRAAQQLIFENAGYTYVIYRDGARPEQMNAYLEVYSPTGQGYAEALWYLYEAEGP